MKNKEKRNARVQDGIPSPGALSTTIRPVVTPSVFVRKTHLYFIYYYSVTVVRGKHYGGDITRWQSTGGCKTYTAAAALFLKIRWTWHGGTVITIIIIITI